MRHRYWRPRSACTRALWTPRPKAWGQLQTYRHDRCALSVLPATWLSSLADIKDAFRLPLAILVPLGFHDVADKDLIGCLVGIKHVAVFRADGRHDLMSYCSFAWSRPLSWRTTRARHTISTDDAENRCRPDVFRWNSISSNDLMEIVFNGCYKNRQDKSIQTSEWKDWRKPKKKFWILCCQHIVFRFWRL